MLCVNIDLHRATFLTPIYLSVSWVLMTSYQLFTETAVATIVSNINASWPAVGLWLSSKQDMIVFIYAFAWVFILSSVIPSVILGKERNVLVQFTVCLILTFSAFLLADALTHVGGGPLITIFSLSFLFTNPLFAVIYLSFPYIFMISMDFYCREKRERERKMEKMDTGDLENSGTSEHAPGLVVE